MKRKNEIANKGCPATGEASSFLNRTEAITRRRGTPQLAVATRRQTPEEQRHWEMAFEVFLGELVRQHLGQEYK